MARIVNAMRQRCKSLPLRDLDQQRQIEIVDPSEHPDHGHSSVVRVERRAVATSDRRVDSFGVDTAREALAAESFRRDERVVAVDEIGLAADAEAGATLHQTIEGLEVEVRGEDAEGPEVLPAQRSRHGHGGPERERRRVDALDERPLPPGHEELVLNTVGAFVRDVGGVGYAASDVAQDHQLANVRMARENPVTEPAQPQVGLFASLDRRRLIDERSGELAELGERGHEHDLAPARLDPAQQLVFGQRGEDGRAIDDGALESLSRNGVDERAGSGDGQKRQR